METTFRHITEIMIYSLIHLENFYVYEQDWYRKETVRPAISKYYRTLRKILRATEPRHRVLTRCANCKIFF